jgi:hypothetical protein
LFDREPEVMGSNVSITNSRQIVEKLTRKALKGLSEVSVVASAGGGMIVWAVKIKSLHSYNFYNVRAVELGSPGIAPSEIGSEVKAVNLAESFLQDGQLSAGTYAVMFRIGDTNTFYVPV